MPSRPIPALVPRAVEEILRFESPVSRQPGFCGVTPSWAAGGSRKATSPSRCSAARTETRRSSTTPDTFDIRRDPNRHIAFGLGPHFCIGAPLSRAEGQIALTTLTKRMPNLELDGAPRWDLDKPNSRVLRELPVRW